MKSFPKKIFINISDHKYPNWKLCLETKLQKLNSKHIEINCEDLRLSCKDISSIIEISNEYNCQIISFFSTCPETIVSSQSLGYQSSFVMEDFSNKSNKIAENNININSDFTTTNFHEGTVRSGDYVESTGDLLILGDVNPGAMVRAEGNIIILGRLLGIAHAGSKGDSQAKISALQLRPVQLRIANKVARGPEEKPQPGVAEQATINSEKIIISPLESL